MSLLYVAKRFLIFLLIIFMGTSVIFFLPRMTPGRDPIAERLATLSAAGGIQASEIDAMVQAYRARFGLDQPLWRQYVIFMSNMLRFDFGRSLALYPARVIDLIAQALPWTIILLTLATLISFAIGTLLGALLGWPRSPKFVHFVGVPLMLLSTIPAFLIGLALVYFLAFQIRLFPLGGGSRVGVMPELSWDYIRDVVRHAILPALSMVLTGLGGWALAMRGMMISVLGEDFITLARARGLPDKRIFLWYAMRNAILPQMTSLALATGGIVSGSILVERVFRYPGIGNLLYRAIAGFDYFLIYGIVFVIVLTIATATFIIDITLPLLDPRIRY